MADGRPLAPDVVGARRTMKHSRLREVVKVIWHWQSVPAQIIYDFRVHRQLRGLPTPMLSRFLEQLRLLWSNRPTAKDYTKLRLLARQEERRVGKEGFSTCRYR